MEGGWYIHEEMNDEARAVLEKALTGFVGSKIVPLTYATKVVSAAVLYKFVCVVTAVSPQAMSHLEVVSITADGKLDGFEPIKL